MGVEGAALCSDTLGGVYMQELSRHDDTVHLGNGERTSLGISS